MDDYNLPALLEKFNTVGGDAIRMDFVWPLEMRTRIKGSLKSLARGDP